jgi:hypothetical protein
MLILTRAALFFTLGLCLASCASHAPIRRPSHSAVERRYDLEGKLIATAFERLGKKTTYDRTTYATALGGEFYTPVNARYPLDDPDSRKVQIREVRWTTGDRHFAVFCTRQSRGWEVFHAIEWDKDRVF